MALEFEWDPSKAAANRRRHAVEFEEAASAFAVGESVSSLPGQPPDTSAEPMKKAPTDRATGESGADELRPEYDFSGGVRGKYASRYAEGTNLVRLDPDVAAAFPDEEAVNDALRALVGIIERTRRTAG